jgi:hypothetical protein
MGNEERPGIAPGRQKKRSAASNSIAAGHPNPRIFGFEATS